MTSGQGGGQHQSQEIHIHTRRKGGIGCCGVFLIAIVAFWFYGNAKDWWTSFREEQEQEDRREEQIEKRREIEADLERFGSEQAPGLRRAIEDLDEMGARDEQRMEKLARTLTALGRDPEEDEDYVRMRERSAEIRRKRMDLETRMEDAFLLWQKFLISQDPAEQKRYEDALRSGEQAALETTRRMEELLEESEGVR